MARGKKADTSKKSKKGDADEEKKVSKEVSLEECELREELEMCGEKVDEVEEVWDITKVLSADTRLTCRMDGCKNAAVAVWASNLDLSDTWPLCEGCQEEEFDGWPEDMSTRDFTDCTAAPDDSTKQCSTMSNAENEDSNQGEDDMIKGGDAKEDDVDPDLNDANREKYGESADNDLPKEDVNSSNLGDVSKSDDPHDTEVDVKVLESTERLEKGNTSDSDKADSSSPTDETGLVTEESEEDASENESVCSKGQKKISDKEDGKDAAVDNESTESDANEDEDDEVWELVKIMAPEDLESPIKCSTDDCVLPAACVYKSNMEASPWFTCLDCQEVDYGGWPENDELPAKVLSIEHLTCLATKCSKQKGIAMPVFPNNATAPSTPSKSDETLETGTNLFDSPPPNQEVNANAVTPSPVVENAKPTKQALAIHKKWQDAAVAMGGPDARIVVNKPAAKKLIFDLLHDSFAPMNITQIHKALKAVVPSPVLKACLDDMALDSNQSLQQGFDDSDDDDGSPVKATKKLTNDAYAGSLGFKGSKSPNTSLYYTDHSKLANGGNGLDRDAREDLISVSVKTKMELELLNTTLGGMKAQTIKLASEPTNEEAAVMTETEESALSALTEQVEEARKLQVNEQYKKQVKRRIESMTSVWRKRRKLCMDFLITMEEVTDGAVCMKKCMKGDGQIDIDSDEAIVKAAVAYAEKKRAMPNKRKVVCRSMAMKNNKMDTSEDLGGVTPDANFVAVTLNSQGTVQRVYLDGEKA